MSIAGRGFAGRATKVQPVSARGPREARPAGTMIGEGPTAVLRGSDGLTVPLEGVEASGRLEGLLLELTVEQRYRNRGDRNLEAVFTFPLPSRAVLLGVELEIGERKLAAVAVARQEATERYEEAIDSGDTAALVEHNGDGLYTVSVGNLMAGEAAVIRYRYAELLDAHDGYLRVNVPTVIAPRYGDPGDAGLEGPAVPGVDLLGEYPFAIRLELAGVREPSAIRSPSHEIQSESGADGLVVTLEKAGFLDRDFVLEIDRARVPQEALIARDGDSFVALASATLGLDEAERRPLALKVLLDCSGSMGGDSIAAARRALLTILERLHPEDRISLTRFGSSVEPVTEGLEPADAQTLEFLKTFVRNTDADLGGTRMADALRTVLKLRAPADRIADVILITDGEIYDIKGVVNLAADSGQRLFAIAIGAAPVEALARSLASKTGGACEFVASGEDPEDAIVRTFKRLRSVPRRIAAVSWPDEPVWQAPLPTAVFPGDTLHLFAGFSEVPEGQVSVTVRDDAGRETVMQVAMPVGVAASDQLPRIAASRRLSTLSAEEASDLAVKYQLASEYTSFVVVAERAEGEKATDLPSTIRVPHMLAAGWGATAESLQQLMPAAMACIDVASVRMSCDDKVLSLKKDAYKLKVSDDIEYAKFRPSHGASFTEEERRALLESLESRYQADGTIPATLDELCDNHPVSPLVRTELACLLVDSLCDEVDLVAVFLALLASSAPRGRFGRAFLSSLRGVKLGERAHRGLRRDLRRLLFG